MQAAKGSMVQLEKMVKWRLIEKAQYWVKREVLFTVCTTSEPVSKPSVQLHGECCLPALRLVAPR